MRTILLALVLALAACGADPGSSGGGDAGVDATDAPTAADAPPLCQPFPRSMDQDCDGNRANGCERRVTSDPMNCGACGNVCPTSLPRCVSGLCGP